MATISGTQFFGGKPGKIIQPADTDPIVTGQSLGEFSGTAQRMSATNANLTAQMQETDRLQREGKIGGGEALLRNVGSAAAATMETIFDLPILNKATEVIGEGVEQARDFTEYVATQVVQSLPEDVRESYRLAPQDRMDPEQLKRVRENTEAILNVINLGLTAEGAAGAFTKVRTAMPALVEKIRSNMPKLPDGPGGPAGPLIDKIKTKVGEIVEQPIPEQVKSALGESKTATFDEYAKTAEQATQSFKNKTPLELAGEKAQAALNDINKQVEAAGKKKAEIMGIGQVGTTIVKPKMLETFNQRLQSFKNSKTVIEGDTKLIRDIKTELDRIDTTNPTANQVDKFIDFAQSKIYSSSRDLTIPVSSETTAALRRFVGELNSSLKNQLPENYRAINDEYSSKIEVRNELNQKLGAEGEKGGALMKRVFSPSDAGTKALFEQVLKLTGVDLVNQATLARFLMETVGDARQVSMLEQLKLPKLSKSGILDLARDYISGKFNTPEKIMQRARQLTKNVPTIPDRVVQVVQGNKKYFYRIPADESFNIIKRIDGSSYGIAGKNIKGKIFHITAKNAEQMLKEGFEDRGVILLKDIPRGNYNTQ